MRFTLRSRQRLRHVCGQGHYSFFYADAPEGFAAARARGLPLREANDTLALLRHAGQVLAAAVARPPSARPALPSRSMLGAVVCDGYLCNEEGQPVIPTGLCAATLRHSPPSTPLSARCCSNVWGFPRSPSPFDEATTGTTPCIIKNLSRICFSLLPSAPNYRSTGCNLRPRSLNHF